MHYVKIKYYHSKSYFSPSSNHSSIQTLMILDLNSNQIGDEAAEHLANALQQNQVLWFEMIFLFNHLFIVLHRHSLHLTLLTMKSMRTEQNVLLMLYIKIMYQDLNYSSLSLIIHLLFYTDTHYTRSLHKSYRYIRNRISG